MPDFFSLDRARNRGAQIVATNAYHYRLRDLYEVSFETLSVSRNSGMSSKVETRKKYKELVILTERTHE